VQRHMTGLTHRICATLPCSVVLDAQTLFHPSPPLILCRLARPLSVFLSLALAPHASTMRIELRAHSCHHSLLFFQYQPHYLLLIPCHASTAEACRHQRSRHGHAGSDHSSLWLESHQPPWAKLSASSAARKPGAALPLVLAAGAHSS
jgi:hypothetical protein